MRPGQYTPLPIAMPLDNSVTDGMERLAPSHLTGDVEEDLTVYSIPYLEKRYPEFVFGYEISAKRPKGKAVSARFKGGWRWAAWRTGR